MDEAETNTPTLGCLGPAARYRLRRELGRGTMGVVYEAEDAVLGRVVAVKTIELAFAVPHDARETFELRFFTEARVAANLSHPGIVVCHDVGKDPDTGTLFIVFEHLKGRTLAERIAEGPLAWREAAAIVLRMAQAIQHAHERGVVHRDLKPANVMLLDASGGAAETVTDASIKIMDFGVAKLESADARLTATGQWFGSPSYLSPERAMGLGGDARADIFSLGSVACTLLLGRPWFDAPSIPETLARVLHHPPPELSMLCPGVPQAMDHVVARALAKCAEDRYPTAAAMAEDLEDLLAGRGPRHTRAALALAEDIEVDALLGHLTGPEPAAGAAQPADPIDALASLVDTGEPAIASETVVHEVAPAPLGSSSAAARGDVAATAQVAATTQVSATEAAAVHVAPTVRRTRRRGVVMLAAAALVATAGLVATANFLLRRQAPPADPPAASWQPDSGQRGANSGSAAAEPPGSPPEGAPLHPKPAASAPQQVAPLPATTAARAPTASTQPAVPAASPALRGDAAARTAAGPPNRPADAGAAAPERTPPTEPAQPGPEATAAAAPSTRMRIEVEHPLEDGRLVMWLDGVPVFETKLRAEVAKKIVAIKIREGHVQTLLDVAPGRHEVRVEVSWDGGRRVASRVADVAPGATGLLEVRLAKITKDLSIEWSRLAAE